MEIKKIDKFSLAKVLGLIYGLIGLIMALFVAVMTMLNIIWQKDFAGSVIIVSLFNLGAGLLLGVITALIGGAFGWIIGLVIAAIYNFLAKKVGGVKVSLDQTSEKD